MTAREPFFGKGIRHTRGVSHKVTMPSAFILHGFVRDAAEHSMPVIGVKKLIRALFRGCISIPLQWISRGLLWVWGWQVLGAPPDEPKYVLVAAPHTSLWDAVVMLALACYFRVRVYWMAKDSLFVGPFGWFLKATGGVPINRDTPLGVVEEMVRQFHKNEHFVLLISPEGTRKRRDYWKSGFYRIAIAAKVPIVSGIMDWEKKESGLVDTYRPTGDIHEDMDHLRAIYTPATGLHPERYGPCRLREEDPEPA